jgi:hypothetical protein
MRRHFIKSLAAVASAMALPAFAASVSLTAGSVQSVTLADPLGNGKLLTLTLPSGGTGKLDFSNNIQTGIAPKVVGGVTSIANVLRHQWTGSEGGVVTEGKTKIGAAMMRSHMSLIGTVETSKIDPYAAKIESIGIGGNFLLTARPFSDLTAGGDFRIKNIRLDFPSKTVFADVFWRPFPSADATSRGGEVKVANVPVWTFDSVQGISLPTSAMISANTADLQKAGFELWPTPAGGKAFAGTITVSKLRMTEQGYNLFASATDLADGSYFDGMVRNASLMPLGWGNMSISVKFSTGTPAASCP